MTCEDSAASARNHGESLFQFERVQRSSVNCDFEAGGWEGRRRARLRKIAGILLYWVTERPAHYTAWEDARATQLLLP